MFNVRHTTLLLGWMLKRLVEARKFNISAQVQFNQRKNSNYQKLPSLSARTSTDAPGGSWHWIGQQPSPKGKWVSSKVLELPKDKSSLLQILFLVSFLFRTNTNKFVLSSLMEETYSSINPQVSAAIHGNLFARCMNSPKTSPPPEIAKCIGIQIMEQYLFIANSVYSSSVTMA